MCTIVDAKATDDLKNKIKKTGIGYAWKLVQVGMHWKTKEDEYLPPFQDGSYSKNRKNVETPIARRKVEFCYDFLDKDEIHGQAFHLFITRSKARNVMTWIKDPRAWPYYRGCNARYKIIKVAFKPQDLIAVGHVSNDFKIQWDLDSSPDAICVHAFKFVK